MEAQATVIPPVDQNTLQQPMQLTCQFCGSVVGPDSNFCPVCGKLLKEPPLGIGRKIYIYTVSLLLPPLGLIWTFKYFRNSDSSYRMVAIVAAILTIISSVVTIWFSLGFINSVQQQLNQYQNLGL